MGSMTFPIASWACRFHVCFCFVAMTVGAELADRQWGQREPDRWDQPGVRVQLPGGTWAHGAADIELMGNRLCARMRRPDGVWAARDCVSFQPGQEFENAAGSFRSIISMRLPGGSWIDTARNFRREGNMLYTDLRRRDFAWVSTYALVDDYSRFSNDNGQLRQTESACNSLGACAKGFVLKPHSDTLFCADLVCDPVVDLDTCCNPAMPCDNLTVCILPQIPDPNGFCLGEECDPARDASVCCIGQAKCDSMACPYGWVPRPNGAHIRCSTMTCDPVRERDLCCEPAQRCVNISETECPRGQYLNDLEFCNGASCSVWRDLRICCQTAAPCSEIQCANGFVGKTNATMEYCEGPACVPSRDSAVCCDPAEACVDDPAIVCSYGFLIPPATYCLGTSCFVERDLDHCCRAAEPCTALGAVNCSWGYFFNDTDYCAGVECEELRDSALCCQPAEPCIMLDCPYGFIAKPQGELALPEISLQRPDALGQALFCAGLLCDITRDRDTCCDSQKACGDFVCPLGFVRGWNASIRLCLGPECVLERDADVCCDVAAACATDYVCPHGYVLKPPPAFCDGTECDAGRDLDRCCFPAMPCTNLTCPQNFVHRPNQYCAKAAHLPNACNLVVDLDTCCDRGMVFSDLRFLPVKARSASSYQVQVGEFNLYFFDTIVAGSKLDEGGVAFSIDGNYPDRESPDKAIDRVPGTKWLDEDPDPKYFPGRIFEFKALSVRLPERKPVDEFSYLTADDEEARDPVGWRLEGSPDGVHWALLHEVVDVSASVPTDRFAETPRFRILVPCYAPRELYIPYSNSTYTCLEGDVVSSGEVCTASCAEGYEPSLPTLACTMGQLTPQLFTCSPS